MRTLIMILALFTTIAMVVTTCNKTTDPVGTGGKDTTVITDTVPKPVPISVGMWHYAFPPIPTFTTDTLNIWLDINSDSSYSLELIERTDKKLFSSKGTWLATDDSIFLTGNDCTLLDTSATPDTLASIADTICQKPISLAQPDGSTWTIKTQSVAAMLVAFPIPAELASTIPLFFPEIPLKKVE